MQRIYIESTRKTPRINFDPVKGLIEIKGRSIPENASFFYRHLIDWIREYSSDPCEKTTVNIMLEYLNTDTQKYLLEMLEQIKPIHTGGNKIDIKWFYEEDDEDMIETGKEYAKITNLPFEFIEIEDFSFLQ